MRNRILCIATLILVAILSFATIAAPLGKSTIVMYSMDGCQPCKMWIENEYDKLIKAGWAVEIRKTSYGPVPRFYVLVGGKVKGSHVGYMSMDKLREILE